MAVDNLGLGSKAWDKGFYISKGLEETVKMLKN